MVRTRQIHNERTTQQIIWSNEHDRYVFIRYDKNGEIDGLGFKQGEDASDCGFNNYEARILELYRQVVYNMGLKDKRFDLETINRVLWLYAAIIKRAPGIDGATEYMNTKDFMDLMEI